MTRQNLVRLMLACLLLAMLVVPIMGTATDVKVVSDDSPHFTLFQGENMGATVIIACIPQDPGGSGGGCGGG